MEFRRLEYFEAVARTGSFTKAAEELCVAQPTITTAIKRMEEELGVALLVRDKRSVMLTCEGKIFLEKVVDILERIEGSVKEMQEMSAANDWMLNIGVAPINGAFVTPVPVSYTHLDVYKRQAVCGGGRRICISLRFLCIRPVQTGKL